MPLSFGGLENKKMTFSNAQKNIVDEKISLNFRGLLLKPACMAGVLISRPNLSPLCRSTKL